MTWKRKIPGEGACGPCCSWKERFNQLWDKAIGCITKINNITPDGDGKFEIRGGTGVQVTPISNGIEINSTATGAGIATINNRPPDSDSNFSIAGASGKTGVTVTNTTHGVGLSIGDFVSTINNVTSDVFGNLDLTAGSNITITPDADNHSIEIASTASGGVTPQDVQDALDSYSPMVRTSGNQLITGNKTFQGELGVNRLWSFYGGGDQPGFKIMNTNPWNITHSEIEFLQFAGTFGAGVSFTAIYNSDGTVTLNAKIRNSNGTIKTVQLAKGDVI